LLRWANAHRRGQARRQSSGALQRGLHRDDIAYGPRPAITAFTAPMYPDNFVRCDLPRLPWMERNWSRRNSFRLDPVHQWRFAMPASDMKDHVYKILELVGSSEKSIEDAVQNAITRASKTIREMKWFEVVQTRGHIEKGSVRHYQVTLRVGFTLEE
jgi:flavin-binding protein dodecin